MSIGTVIFLAGCYTGSIVTLFVILLGSLIRHA